MSKIIRPSTAISAEIAELTIHSRQLVRMIRHGEDEVASRRKLLEINSNRVQTLFVDKAESERNEEWLTKPKIVWAETDGYYFTEGDYRAISVSAKQIRVGRIGSGGCVSLYQKTGNPVGRATGMVIDIEKTFPEGLPK